LRMIGGGFFAELLAGCSGIPFMGDATGTETIALGSAAT
jgi:hypothetical protein